MTVVMSSLCRARCWSQNEGIGHDDGGEGEGEGEAQDGQLK